MNKKVLFSSAIILIICLFSCNLVYSDNIDSTSNKNGISINYWKGFIDGTSGFNVGFERSFLKTQKYNIIGNISIISGTKKESYFMSGIILGNTIRRTYKFGLFFDHSFRLGYLGSYYFDDIYRIKNNEIVNVHQEWLSSATFGYAFGLGYDFSKISKLDIQLFARPSIFLRYPNFDNLFIMNNINFELGLCFRPDFLN